MEFGTFSGCIMKEDLALVEFSMEKGVVTECRILEEEQVPYEYRICKNPRKATWFFLEDRVVPSTRIGINEDVKRVGLPYYDPTLLLKYNHGYSVTDLYWIRFQGETLTYGQLEEWVRRGGKEA